jgi:hypothetical protein
MRHILKQKDKDLNRTIFQELLTIIKIKKSNLLTEDIFKIFDDNKDNIIDFDEMIVGISIFNESKYHTKIKSKNNI